METVGQRIRKARKEAKLTQQELANRVGVIYAATVSDWERDAHQPTARHLAAIARETGKRMDWFVDSDAPFLSGRGVA